MKRHLITIITAFTFCILNAQVKWINSIYDFGAFSEDLAAVDATFKFVNESDKPIRVIDARATCGCTQPKLPKTDVEPGDTAEIKVTYLAAGRPGKFSKNIYVKISDKPSENRTLTVNGTVIGSVRTLSSRYPIAAGSMRLKSNNAAFGEVTRGKLKTIYLEAYNMTADTLYPQLNNLPEFIDANIRPNAVAPGEQAHVSLTLQSTKVPDWGISKGEFTFIANENEEPIQIDYFTIITEDFNKLTPGQRIKAPIASADPHRIDLGEVPATEIIEVEFKVKNSGQSPLIIRRLQTSDDVIVNAYISKTKIGPNKSAKVKITIDPSKATTDFISTQVLLINNDPENSLLVERITAEIIR